MQSTSVLLIDDDEDLTDLLSEYLTSEGLEITIKNDGVEGLNAAIHGEHQLILLDVMLPGMDGFEVLKQLRQKKMTPVIMLTAKGDDFDRIFGLELGADDYLPKPFNHRELLARIRAMTRRMEHLSTASISPNLAHNGVRIVERTREIYCEDNLVPVTGTEFQMMKVLLESVGEIVSKDQLSQEALGRKLSPFDRSIDMHVSNIRKKLGKFTRNEKIKTVRGVGYIFLQGEADP
ncbi:response regulator transcription factor [Algicola sagamiensis]|uniref:response regulator transcription factor n=1 Tax=Algicola sagamiensis TaxID=163869 RepID=UPI000380426D|nr:response regulator transcription factor [Algicola sagamiensis]